MVFCRAIGMTEVHHFRDGSSSSEHHYYRNRVVAAVWPWIQFFDAVISVVFLVYIPMMSGVVLVCDRFLHDLIIDLMVDTGSSTLHKRMVGKLILHLVPRQSLVFVLDVDESIILMRKNDIPSMDYLRKRRKLYRLLAAYLDLPLLDCSQPFDVVHNTLTKCMSLAGCF
jgi:dTMP kinase